MPMPSRMLLLKEHLHYWALPPDKRRDLKGRRKKMYAVLKSQRGQTLAFEDLRKLNHRQVIAANELLVEAQDNKLKRYARVIEEIKLQLNRT